MPVSNITWNEAALFCNWINEQTRRAACYDQMNPETACDTSAQGFRMPLRAESEYAGLARAKTIFPFGGMEQMESLQDYSWYLSATVAPKSNTCPSGYKMPNGWGLFDVIGNANEWCSDGKADDNLSRYCQGGHNQCAMNELLLGLPSIDMRTSRQCEGIRLVLRTE
jgi:formylglycine-generating enzyme required for sulfatase activity